MRLMPGSRSIVGWTIALALFALAIPAQALAVASVEVRESLFPADDAGKFNLLIAQGGTTVASSTNVGDGGTAVAPSVTAGTYQVSQTAGTGTTLANYGRVITCKNGGTIVAGDLTTPAGAAPPIAFQVADGDNVVCVIVNRRNGVPLITEFTAKTETDATMPQLPVPGGQAPSQAGAHPNLRLYQRFCGRPDLLVQTLESHGCDYVSLNNAGLKDFRLRLPRGMIGNPTAVLPCPYHLFLAFSCPPTSAVGFSATIATGIGTDYRAYTPLYVVERLGWEPARLGTSIIPTVPPGPLPIQVSLRTADDPNNPSEFDGDFGIDSLLANVPAAPPSGQATDIGGIPIVFIDTLLCSRAPCITANTGVEDPTLVQPAVPLAQTKPFIVNPTSCGEAKWEQEAVGWDRPSVKVRATSNTTQVRTPVPIELLENGGIIGQGAGQVMVTLAAPHRLESGDSVTIAGATPVAVNGTWVATRNDDKSFTITVPALTGGEFGGGGTATGFEYVKTTGPTYSTTGCDAVDPTGPTPANEPPTENTSTDPDTVVDPPFNMNAEVLPESSEAGAGTAVTVRLKYCSSESPSGECNTDYSGDDVWPAHLKDADVTLPEGMTLSASGGNGLEACTYEQFYGPDVHGSSEAEYAKRTDEAVKCPAGSQIGTIKVSTPALGDELFGKAFFGPTGPNAGRPTTANPWKLFLLLEGQGVRIKLRAGDVSLSESGQVRTIFNGNPEVPFATFELTTNGGTNSVLRNPATCGPHTGHVEFTSHGDATANTPTVIREPAIETTGCVDPQPFQPIINDASATPTQAGANSVSHLNFKVPDGHQDLRSLTLHLPAGAVGSLAASELCPVATVNALASDPNVNCPDSSKVGTIRTTVGSGSSLLQTPGKVYIGEATQFGDAASFVIVVPAKVGPINLGRVVLVNRAVLRSSDTGIDVFADTAIPNILEGVPLPIREIDITIDREGFFLNPTGCNAALFVADFTAYQGGAASATFPTAATGCEALDFAPKLRIIAGGDGLTGLQDNPSLKAIVTQRKGEANISEAKVLIPDIIRPDVPQIQKAGTLCSDDSGRSCPPSSQVGTAEVITPVLPFKLSGPVYITLQPGQPLPNLVVFLRGPGGLEVVLRAANGFQGIRILNTFKNVPDVPQSRFELNVKGGPDGILLNYKDLCTTNPLPDVTADFTGHNGKKFHDTPQLEAAGCDGAGASGGKGAYISKNALKMKANGTVPIKLTCPGRTRTCGGSVTLETAPKAAGASATFGRKSYRLTRTRGRVNVKLNQKTQRRVKRAKRIRARVVAKSTGAGTSRRIVTIRR